MNREKQIKTILVGFIILIIPGFIHAQNLEYISSTLVSDGIYTFNIIGSYAYACGLGGLSIFSLEDPVSPSFITHDPSLGGVSLFRSGHFLYEGCGYYGLKILDISDSTSPALVGQYETPGHSNHVFVVGNYAYVIKEEGELEIIDVSNPSQPSLAGTFSDLYHPRGIFVADSLAYLTDSDSGLVILNVSNPHQPVLLSRYGDEIPDQHDFQGITIVDTLAFVTDGPVGLRIINVSDPRHPELLSLLTPCVNCGDARVIVSGDYALMARWCYLFIININDPLNPVLAATYGLDYNSPVDLSIIGDTVYVPWDYSGVRTGVDVVDVTDHANPTKIGQYLSPFNPKCVTVGDQYAYVGALFLYIMDISNPYRPRIAGVCDSIEVANDISILGNYAYIAAGDSGLQVVRIDDPANPRLISTQRLLGEAMGVWVDSNYAYLTTDMGGIEYFGYNRSRSAACRFTLRHWRHVF